MDKDEEVEPQQPSNAMDEDQQQGVDDDPYGFLVEQCIIPSAEENQLRSMPLFSPSPFPTPTHQQQPSPPPVVKHEQTDNEIDIIMHQQQQQQQPPLEMDKEKETQNMEVDDDEESQSVTKQPTISVERSPPHFENEGFSLQSPPPPTRDEPAATIDDGTTPSPDTGKELQKTIEDESPLEQNEGLVVQPQSPPTKTQPGQTHFVEPPRVQPTATATAVGVGVGVGASSSSSSNPGNPKEEDNTTIDMLDVLRSRGFYVPRPRWWRPEGYDKP